MPSDVWIAIISGGSGIVVAYITTVLARRVQANKAAKQPKDRMEQMFDGYERMLRRQDYEDERKSLAIKALKGNVEDLEEELSKTRTELAQALTELGKSRQENQELKTLLKEVREEYRRVHKKDKVE